MNQANTFVGSFVRVTYPNGKWKGSYEGYVYEVRPRGCEILWKDGSDRGSLTYVKYKFMEIIGSDLVTEKHMQEMIEHKLQVQLPGGVIKGSIPTGCGKRINVEEGEDAFPLQPTSSGIVAVNDEDKEGEDAEDSQPDATDNSGDADDEEEGENAKVRQADAIGIIDDEVGEKGRDANLPLPNLSGMANNNELVEEWKDANVPLPNSSGLTKDEYEDEDNPPQSSRKRKLESLEQRVKNMERFMKNFSQTVNAQQQNIFDILASRRTPATPKKGRNEAEV